MGAGAALFGSNGLAQVPRLTAVLRSLGTDHGDDFDPDAALLRRQQQLQAGPSSRDGGGTTSDALAARLLGPWDRAPL